MPWAAQLPPHGQASSRVRRIVLTQTAVLVLVLIGLCAVLSYVTMSRGIQAQQHEGQVINLAARQGLHTQRIAALAQSLLIQPPGPARDALRQELQVAVDDMTADHAQLSDPKAELYGGFPATQDIRDLYFGPSALDSQVQRYLKAARALIAVPGAALTTGNTDLQYLGQAARGPLPPALDAVVDIEVRWTTERLGQLDTTQRISLTLTLLALVAVGFGVLLPLIRRQDRTFLALEQERNFARQLMDLMGQGLAVTGPDHRFSYVNPAFTHLCGYTPDELRHLSPLDLLDPKDRADFVTAMAVPLEGHRTITHTYRHRDGRAVHVMAVVVPHDLPNGKGSIAVVTDLTDRLHAEQRLQERERLYRTLAANFPDGALMLFDADTRYTLVDGQGLAQVNLHPGTMQGRRPAELFPAWIAEQIETDYAMTLAGRTCEREIRAAGRVYLLRTLPLPATDAAVSNEPRGISIVQDVTRERLAEQALQRAATYTDALLQVSLLSNQDLTPEAASLKAAAIVGQCADVDWWGLARVSEHSIDLQTSWDSGRRTANEGAFRAAMEAGVQRGQGMVWRAVTEQRAVYLDDYAALPTALPGLLEGGVRSVAFLPLPGMSGVGHIMVAIRREKLRPWTQEDRALFESAARSIQLNLERRQYVALLEEAALVDALTGLGNRRAFERDLQNELDRTRRSGEPFGLLMIDLDGLKQVNDHEGHDRGDALLATFARTLTQSLRGEDRVYRLGGDEYAAILVRAGMEAQETLEMRVRRAVGRTRLEGFTNVDASAGIAFALQEELQADALMRRADERMYRQKQQHRLARQDPGRP